MSKVNSNRRKDELLGEPHGTAQNRLRKMLLFKYAHLAGDDVCIRCGLKIERVADFSVEHMESWQKAIDPRAAFFDLRGIMFSHLKCNVEVTAFQPGNKVNPNGLKTHCLNGHELNADRICKICIRDRFRGYRAKDKNYGRGGV